MSFNKLIIVLLFQGNLGQRGEQLEETNHIPSTPTHWSDNSHLHLKDAATQSSLQAVKVWRPLAMLFLTTNIDSNFNVATLSHPKIPPATIPHSQVAPRSRVAELAMQMPALERALGFLAAESAIGTRAAFFGRALFMTNSLWSPGMGTPSAPQLLRAIVSGYAGGVLCPLLLLAAPPVPAMIDLPVLSMVAAHCLFFGTLGIFGKLYRSSLGNLIGLVLECMFRANLVCTFTVAGSQRLASTIGPLACGVFAGTGGQWLNNGYGAAADLVKPRTPMFLALMASVWTLLCTNADKYGWPIKLAQKEAQRYVVVAMIVSELAKRWFPGKATGNGKVATSAAR